MPDVLMNIYTEISNYVHNLTNTPSNMLTGKEKSTLQEFLLSIIYYSSQPTEQKQTLFDPIVSTAINEWGSPHITCFISSLSQFCEASGINLLSSVVNDMKQNGVYNKGTDLDSVPSGILEQHKIARTKLVCLENTILIWLRRTTESVAKGSTDSTLSRADVNLWGKYVPTILSTTLELIRLLHQLWNVETWREIPVELQEILALAPEEKATILGLSQKSPLTDSYSKQHTVMGVMDQIRKWLSTLRIDCYYVIGRLTVLGPAFYSIPNAHESLTQALFENAESLNNIHWKMLLNSVVRPYVLNCPTPEILSGFLPQLVKYMDEKLSAEWAILAAKGISVSAAEESNEIRNLDLTSDASDEILSEHLLRDLTRAYIGIFDQVYAPASKKQTDDKVVTASENAELKEYILNYMLITEPFLMSLCHLLTFKDSVACVRTAQLCSRILPNLVGREVLREFVGKTLLTAALQALNDGYHKEIHPVIISLITDLYIDLRPVSPIPYETFAQLLNMDHVQLQEFETSLGRATESKARKIIVKNFLEGITGLSTGEWFKVPDVSSTVSARRVVYGNYEKPQLGVLDIVEDPNEVGIERWFE